MVQGRVYDLLAENGRLRKDVWLLQEAEHLWNPIAPTTRRASSFYDALSEVVTGPVWHFGNLLLVTLPPNTGVDYEQLSPT